MEQLNRGRPRLPLTQSGMRNTQLRKSAVPMWTHIRCVCPALGCQPIDIRTSATILPPIRRRTNREDFRHGAYAHERMFKWLKKSANCASRMTPVDDPVELQRRIADEGYLFFRQLQNPANMLELRSVMMAKIQEVGWLLPHTDPVDGIADISKQCTEGDREYTAGYSQVYKLEAFHRAGHWPK